MTPATLAHLEMEARLALTTQDRYVLRGVAVERIARRKFRLTVDNLPIVFSQTLIQVLDTFRYAIDDGLGN